MEKVLILSCSTGQGHNSCAQAIKEYFEAQGTAEWDAWAENMRGILAGSRMPTAVDVAARLISFNIVVGTVLSMVTAVIVKVAGRRFGSFGRFDNN